MLHVDLPNTTPSVPALELLVPSICGQEPMPWELFNTYTRTASSCLRRFTLCRKKRGLTSFTAGIGIV